MQLTKFVLFIPRAFALSFISCTNPSTLPDNLSAIATQLSFALATMIDLISSPALYSFPLSRKTCDPPILAATSLTGTISSRESSPLSTLSRASKVVIIFTMLAIGSLSSERDEYISIPVALSTKYTALPFTLISLAKATFLPNGKRVDNIVNENRKITAKPTIFASLFFNVFSF